MSCLSDETKKIAGELYTELTLLSITSKVERYTRFSHIRRMNCAILYSKKIKNAPSVCQKSKDR